MEIVVARSAVAALSICLLALSGCAAIGFDPLDDKVSALPQGGDGMSGGISGTLSTGGQGGSGGRSGQGGIGGGSGTGGSSGIGGSGGVAGNIMPTGGRQPVEDGGMPVVTQCTGKPNLTLCDDGQFCTLGEFCWDGFCVGGEDRSCDDECNRGSCDEAARECVLTPLPNDTECGDDSAVMCRDGVCPAPAEQCTVDCNPRCDGDGCSYDCDEVNSCRPKCINGADCEVDCQGTAECKLECLDSTCMLQCERSGTCDARCSGQDAVCSVVCTDPSGCEASRCQDGASCALFCIEEAEECGFIECWAGQARCDDGTVVCNASCEDEARWSGWSGRW